MSSKKSLDYRSAGVDIDAGNELVERIKPLARRTQKNGVLAGIGGFAALFDLPIHRYREPVLVSCTDGVGTKLKLATELSQHNTIGIDLVAMCVNDLIVCGAEPLFFLDYFATGKLDVAVAEQVIAGIAAGCEQAGAALIGGETAEMPGMYQHEDYDLAGFSVGIVEKKRIIDGSAIQPGDAIIGLASSGPHSNGYSLIRKIISENKLLLTHLLNGQPLSEHLLVPTKIYVKSILHLLSRHPIHGMAHITGGGLLENIPRVLPPHCKAIINKNSWQRPAIFSWLQEKGNVAEEEMYRVFNCGIGMIVIVSATHLDDCLTLLNQQGEQATFIGTIAKKLENETQQVELQ